MISNPIARSFVLATTIWCSRAPPRPDVELAWHCRGATAACTSSGCSCAKPRPLVGNKRLFLFGERCLRKGRSAAAGGRGRNGLHEGCRQRLSAEAHGHGVLLLCAGCAMSAWRSAKRCGDVLDKNISLNSARGQKSTLKNKGHRHLKVTVSLVFWRGFFALRPSSARYSYPKHRHIAWKSTWRSSRTPHKAREHHDHVLPLISVGDAPRAAHPALPRRQPPIVPSADTTPRT